MKLFKMQLSRLFMGGGFLYLSLAFEMSYFYISLCALSWMLGYILSLLLRIKEDGDAK